MQLDPLFRQVGHSPFRQPAIGQRLLHQTAAGHEPVSPTTARGFGHLRPGNAQTEQLPSPMAGAFPALPEVEPDPPSQPLVQLGHHRVTLAEAKIVQPPDRVAPQFPQHAEGRNPAAAAGDFSNPLLEPCLCFPGPLDPAPAYLEAKERTLTERRSLALLAVDHQLEPGFDITGDALHHPLGGTQALDQNQEIIGVTCETQPTLMSRSNFTVSKNDLRSQSTA